MMLNVSDGLGFLAEETERWRPRHITSAIILGGKVACYFKTITTILYKRCGPSGSEYLLESEKPWYT